MLFIDQRRAREQTIQNYQTFVDNFNQELSAAKRDRVYLVTLEKFEKQLAKKNLNNFMSVDLDNIYIPSVDCDGYHYNIKSYRGIINIEAEKKCYAGRLDGFWLLVTNHTERVNNDFLVPAVDAIKPYRDKLVIEQAFRDIKSFVEVAPIYVWTENHVKAHFTICVLSYLINRVITLMLHRNPGKKTSAIITHEKLYEVLAECQINKIHIKNTGIKFYQMTNTTKDLQELLSRLKLNNLLSGDILKKMNNSNCDTECSQAEKVAKKI